MVVLVNFGNMHNFLYPSISHKAQLGVDKIEILPIKIANSDIVQGHKYYYKVSFILQVNHFTSFYLLNLGGSDVILGVSWLEALGPIVLDFC